MSETLVRIQGLVAAGHYRLSNHAYLKLEERDILATRLVAGLSGAILVEEYPDASRGPTVLVLVRDDEGNSFHAVWGVPEDSTALAVLITAYRPDASEWNAEFTVRIRP